jgi:ESF2/ABP1 family protein
MSEIVNDYENIELLEKGEDEVELTTDVNELKEKIRRSGVIYISSIPLGMTISSLRKLLSDYGAKRIYLIPIKEKVSNDQGKKIQAYKEGWVEFEEKLYAKLAEYQLNGKPIGGNKSCSYKDDLWTIKYLHKFKWHNLIESLNFKKNVRDKQIKTELAQSRRENDFILKKYEQSKMLKRKKQREEKEDKANDNDNNDNNDNEDDKNDNVDAKEALRKKFKQKTPIIKHTKKE